MTLWTRKFLKKLQDPRPCKRDREAIKGNRDGAHRLLKFPKPLWEALHRESSQIDSQWYQDNVIFLAGVAVGWNEAKKVKP